MGWVDHSNNQSTDSFAKSHTIDLNMLAAALTNLTSLVTGLVFYLLMEFFVNINNSTAF